MLQRIIAMSFRAAATAPAAVLLWLFSLTGSFAGISAPSSSACLSPDGKHLLVMVSPVADYEKLYPTKFSFPDRRSIVLNETFSKSGVYDAATFAPLWQVDWFSLSYDLRFSPDFTDVVRLNRLGLKSTWALEFYHNDHLTNRYSCGELLTALKSPTFLPFKSWDWHYAWYDTLEVKGDRLFVSTAPRQIRLLGREINLGLQESYVFDLTTGAMINQTSISAIGWQLTVILVPLLLLLFGFWLWHSGRRRGLRSQELRQA